MTKTLIYLDVSTSNTRKEGQRAMNREEGSYQLSHAYDCFLLAHLLLTVPRTGRRIDFHSSDEDFRNVKVY